MNELEKSIHDNANGLDYTLVNDHYLQFDRSSPGSSSTYRRWAAS